MEGKTETEISKGRLVLVFSIALVTIYCFAGAKYFRKEVQVQEQAETKIEVTETQLTRIQESSRGYIDRTIKIPVIEKKEKIPSSKEEVEEAKEEIREIKKIVVLEEEKVEIKPKAKVIAEGELKPKTTQKPPTTTVTKKVSTPTPEEKPAPQEEPAQKKEEPAQKKEEPAQTANTQTFKATSYDLSVQSCGKPIGHKEYGITRNGSDISGKTREQSMSIAVDPNVIPLGSKVKITFPEPYTHFNGVYTANDTGGAIKGKMVDIFMGDFGNNKSNQSVWDFGVRQVQVEVLK